MLDNIFFYHFPLPNSALSVSTHISQKHIQTTKRTVKPTKVTIIQTKSVKSLIYKAVNYS